MPKYLKNKNCRLCNSKKLNNVFDLNATPPANAFRISKKIKYQTYPLNVNLCLNCKHLQLINIIDPKILFTNYFYTSGVSHVYIKHLKQYANSLIIKYKLNSKKDKVCDIGSNDGTFLKFFKEKKFNILGIEPSKNLSRLANNKLIHTKNEFFGTKFVHKNPKVKDFKIITSNHVFAHIKDIKDFALAVKKILRKDGIFIFEVGYLADVIKNKYFDTIYHEHLDFHHVYSLKKFFESLKMKIIDVERTKAQGGSIRVHVVNLLNDIKENKRVTNFVKLENKMGLSLISTYKKFFKDINKEKNNCLKSIQSKNLLNKKIIGYGAPAKATTFLAFYEIPTNLVKYIIDDSKFKKDLYMPGYDIQIKNFKYLEKANFDYIIIFAWNFNDSIIKKIKTLKKTNNFDIILLLPKLKVIKI